MIATTGSPLRRGSAGSFAQAAGQRVGFVEVVETELDGDAVALGADGDLLAQRGLERVAGGLQRRGLLAGRPALASALPLAGQPAEPCSRSRAPTSRRATASRASRRRTSLPRAPSRARPWPSLSSPPSSSSRVSSGSSSRRIRLETAGRLRPTRRASSSLLRPRSSTSAAQALRLLDRVEVLANHVLDQRRLQPLGFGLVADDRRDLVEARLPRRPPAALAGDQLVAAVGEGPDEQRLDHAAGLDRRRQRRQRLLVELGPRLRRGWA